MMLNQMSSLFESSKNLKDFPIRKTRWLILTPVFVLMCELNTRVIQRDDRSFLQLLDQVYDPFK